jgi:hypothetical protein
MNIIGAGLAGLVLGYQTNSPVYGKDLGGQMADKNSRLFSGPRILEADENTFKLVKDLGIDAKPRAFYVGYVSDNGLVLPSATAEERLAYYHKTRGIEAAMPSSVMSGGNNMIIGWDMYEIDLIKRLSEKVTFIPSFAFDVDFVNNKLRMCDFNRNKFDLELSDSISTLNLKFLLKLINAYHTNDLFYLTSDSNGSIIKKNTHLYDLNLTAFDTDFTVVSFDYPLIDIDKYDYAYFVSENNPLNRITKVGDRKYCIESRGDKSSLAYDYMLRDMKVSSFNPIQTLRNVQIQESHNILEIGFDRPEYYWNRLKMAGRYARWNHKIKINDILEEAKEYAGQMGK